MYIYIYMYIYICIYQQVKHKCCLTSVRDDPKQTNYENFITHERFMTYSLNIQQMLYVYTKCD